MSNQADVQVPEEAVIAAARRRHPLFGSYTDDGQIDARRGAESDLVAALPSLLAHFKERLLSDEAKVAAASKHQWWDLLAPDSRMDRVELIEEIVTPMLEAALAAAFQHNTDSQGGKQ